MDRLICGDVGFGKTEVALRAAFAAAMAGKQVAVVVPTTLLARQHYKTFRRALRGPAGQGRARLAAGRRGRGGQARQGGPRRRRRSTSSSAPMRCSARRSQFRDLGLAGHRRGAAFRRQAQGAAEGAASRCACADAVGDADPAHPAARADRRARALDHRHAAGRPPGGADLHLAVRPGGHARGAAARALSRRAELLCRARASRIIAEAQAFLDETRARGQVRRRPWPDGGRPSSKTS